MEIKLENYQKLKELEGNSQNKIFIVMHKKLKKKMIMKFVKIINRRKQLREIRVHEQLNSRYVVKLIKYEITSKYIILLLEFIQRGDLFSNLRKLQEKGLQSQLQIYYQVLQSIKYLHS